MAKGLRHRTTRCAVATVTLLTAGAWMSAVPAGAASKSTTAAKQFVTKLDHALRDANVDFLLGHLDAAVIDRYGKAQCQTYLAGFGKNSRIKAKKFLPAADYAYTTDAITSTVHKVYSVEADVTIGGQTASTTIHVTKSTWFTDCGTPTAAADLVVAAAKRFEGRYTGRWNNVTFGSTGSAELTITVDATTRVVHATMTLGGNVFGGTAPGPLTFDLPLDATDPTKPINVNSPFFGPLTVALGADGSLTANGTNVPGGVIATLQARLGQTATGIDGTYALTFRAGGNANGTITMTKA